MKRSWDPDDGRLLCERPVRPQAEVTSQAPPVTQSTSAGSFMAGGQAPRRNAPSDGESRAPHAPGCSVPCTQGRAPHFQISHPVLHRALSSARAGAYKCHTP
jgi:hypothetical protein